MIARTTLVARLRARLLRHGYPRLQMTLLVAMTCGIGFIASSLLLDAGVERMALRYALAVGVAYLSFLALLWLWLRSRARDLLDGPDGSMIDGPGGGHGAAPEYGGHGGHFGGGGSSGSFDGGHALPDVPDALGSALDGTDEAALPLAALAIVVAIACSSLWLVYSAPTLFAELAVDVLLGAGLYRRLRRVDSNAWLTTAVRRTAWPFALTMITVVATAFVATHFVPDAHSIGDLLLAAR